MSVRGEEGRWLSGNKSVTVSFLISCEAGSLSNQSVCKDDGTLALCNSSEVTNALISFLQHFKEVPNYRKCRSSV